MGYMGYRVTAELLDEMRSRKPSAAALGWVCPDCGTWIRSMGLPCPRCGQIYKEPAGHGAGAR